MIAEPTDRMLTILIVEDESMIGMLLEDLLQECACRVVGPANSVAQSIALIETGGMALDGAFLDINLRGEFVYPVADALLARNVPFMFITGNATYGIDPRYGAVRTLKKPFMASAIERAVKYFAEQRGSF
ncbi:response regulator [Acidocella aquatica]|uniref:Response regulator n=1 Tax=Acidocella aquatica TaxID=1922313 RepID=A0ABQ6AAR1_9PROT|nr:response regulator [Acidocella aquatica]GLR68852.1 response regulator [Acidocella aquatica]